jgi:hypothetical protein
MNITVDTQIAFPRDVVYATYRDRLTELTPYLPNVLSIVTTSRQDLAGKVTCMNEWRGGGEIPLALRTFLSEDLLAWTEHAIWDTTRCVLDWRIETHAFRSAVKCGGQNTFLAQGDSTIIQHRGQITIDAASLQGIPWPLGGSVAQMAEAFLGQHITSNIRQMSHGVESYLKKLTSSQGKTPPLQ